MLFIPVKEWEIIEKTQGGRDHGEESRLSNGKVLTPVTSVVLNENYLFTSKD